MIKPMITKKAKDYLSKDNEYKVHVLENVKQCGNDLTLTVNGGSCLNVSKPKFKVEKGMKVRFYGKGFGYTVRGVAIEDKNDKLKIIYYRTPKEAEQNHQKYYRNEDKKKQKKFEENKEAMDKEYESLPELFRKRIDRFRSGNSNFRRDFEGYEMFCCKEAIKIANALKTEDNIRKWKDLNYDEQKKLVDIEDGHSGNTFGCSVTLAILYVSNPEFIIQSHGALATLVGCKEYGCTH
jgi:hypothetical protein